MGSRSGDEAMMIDDMITLYSRAVGKRQLWITLPNTNAFVPGLKVYWNGQPSIWRCHDNSGQSNLQNRSHGEYTDGQWWPRLLWPLLRVLIVCGGEPGLVLICGNVLEPVCPRSGVSAEMNQLQYPLLIVGPSVQSFNPINQNGR